MSNFDPSSPSYVPPGGIVTTDRVGFNIMEGNSTAVQLLVGGTVLSASTAITVNNPSCRGAMFLFDIVSFPASGSTTAVLKIQTVDPGRNTVFTHGAGAARSASGITQLTIYPGVTGSTSAIFSQVLPKNFQAKISLSTGATSKEVSLSLTMWLLR